MVFTIDNTERGNIILTCDICCGEIKWEKVKKTRCMVYGGKCLEEHTKGKNIQLGVTKKMREDNIKKWMEDCTADRMKYVVREDEWVMGEERHGLWDEESPTTSGVHLKELES